MIKPGYLEITDKVRFVYHELKKPDLDNFKKHPVWAYAEYDKARKAYKVSKRTVEVSNVKDFLGNWVLTETEVSVEDLGNLYLYNNQPCKAEVNGKATIIELIK